MRAVGDFVLYLVYLGGAAHVSRHPTGGFWDSFIWPYYIGRYLASSFAGFAP